ncbi:MAG: CBS domain-containing protein [Spirochaetales bacterium]|jgi:CBS domain-containing protein
MKTAGDILATKGTEVVTIDAEAMVIQALVLMAETNIGAVLVTGNDGSISGIFSERDLARKIVVKGRGCETSRVGELMTAAPLSVSPEASLGECMQIMTERKFRHIPVMRDSRLLGIISIGDVVKTLISDKDRTIAEQAFELGQIERTNMGAV